MNTYDILPLIFSTSSRWIPKDLKDLARFSLKLLLVMSFAVQAQIYKWTDAEGNVHFGDERSREARAQNTQSEEISGKLPQLNVSQGSDTGYVLSGESASEKRARIQAQKEEERAARKPACDEARKELSIISGPVYFTREDGSEYTISESERAELERELRAEIDRYCD